MHKHIRMPINIFSHVDIFYHTYTSTQDFKHIHQHRSVIRIEQTLANAHTNAHLNINKTDLAKIGNLPQILFSLLCVANTKGKISEDHGVTPVRLIV